MAGSRLLAAFTVSRPVTLGSSQPYSTHLVPKCSAQVTQKDGKKRAKQGTQSPPESGKLVTDISVGDELIGTVAEVGPANSSWVDIGVFTKRGRPVHGRLPFPAKKGRGRRTDLEGAVVAVYVKSVNRHAGRIEVRKGVRPRHRNENPSAITMLDALRVGDKLDGTVVGLGPYGAVVDANIYRVGKGGKLTACHGLLQRKSFRKEWYSEADQVVRSDAEKCISKGETVAVYVRAAHVQNAFLLFDGYELRTEDVAKARQQHRTATRRRHRRAPVDSLEVGEVIRGIVISVARYGLFVDVGVKTNGLIHYSEMGERHKVDWTEAVDVNTHLTVEVLKVKDNKISLRLVSVVEEALQDALEVAKSATARIEDVEVAAALQESNKRGYVGKIVSSDNSDRAKAANQAKTTQVGGSDLQSNEDSDNGIEHKKKDEEDQEEQDKFSDEYFEDKYGF